MSEKIPMDTEAEESKDATGPQFGGEQEAEGNACNHWASRNCNRWVRGRTCNRWGVALLAALGLAIIGSGMTFLLFSPSYEAVAWLQIDSRQPYIAFEDKSENQETGKIFVQTQIQLLRSPMVLGPVLADPRIARLPEIAAQTDPVNWLSKQINVKQVGDSELYQVIYHLPRSQSRGACGRCRRGPVFRAPQLGKFEPQRRSD